MKKTLALILTALLCLTGIAALAEQAAPAEDDVVKPIPVQIDLNNIPDGEYPAEFDPEDLFTVFRGDLIGEIRGRIDLVPAGIVEEEAGIIEGGVLRKNIDDLSLGDRIFSDRIQE